MERRWAEVVGSGGSGVSEAIGVRGVVQVGRNGGVQYLGR